MRHRVGRALSWDRVCGRFYSNAELEAGAASVGAVRRALSFVAVARGGFGARGTLYETICVLPRRNDRAFSLRPSFPTQIVRLRCSPDKQSAVLQRTLWAVSRLVQRLESGRAA